MKYWRYYLLQKVYLASSIFLFAFSSVLAQEKSPITAEDYFNLKDVGDPQISPDGLWVAYTIKEKDLVKDKSESSIWMIPYAGGEAIRMTGEGYAAWSPSWSPEGKYLSFLASKNKGEETQVWGLNRLGGEAQRLTCTDRGISSYKWAPDGKRMLLRIKDHKTQLQNADSRPLPYVIDRLQFKRDGIGYLDRRRIHLYIQEIGSTQKPRQLTFGDYDDYSPRWSPDGKHIVFSSNRTEEPDANHNRDLWLVKSQSVDPVPDLVQLTTNPGRDDHPAWSPDGKLIAFRSDRAPRQVGWYSLSEVAVVSIEHRKVRTLTSDLDRNAFWPQFSSDSKSIWFMLEDDGQEQLALLDLNSREITREIASENIVWEFHLVGEKLVTLSSRFDLPFEVFTYHKTLHRQLTETNKGALAKWLFSSPESIRFNSSNDQEVHGYAYKPIHYEPGKKYPTIIWIHGGPVLQYNAKYAHRTQLFTAQGYLVLHLNPRGSSGRGLDYSFAISADWGNLDYQDVMAGLDYLIQNGHTDEKKLGVGGWSYGGFLTSAILTKNERFHAAISGATISLFQANYGHDQWQLHTEIELGLPWENHALYEKLSPFNQIEKITTPTLWMGGDKDWNVPIMNGEQMYMGMKRLGRETQLVVYPDEAHWPMRRPSFIKDRWERYLAWFDKYLKGQDD